jgi:hypothetical protein
VLGKVFLHALVWEVWFSDTGFLIGDFVSIVLTGCFVCWFSEQSESASTVGAGETVPATVAECMPAASVFNQVLTTFRIHDWSLFGYVDE